MKNMTTGKPLPLIIGFAIPMLIGNLFQQIYNVVDTLIVGRYLGENALAGVGSTGTLTFFLLSLVYGLCTGAGLVSAQYFGNNKTEELKKSLVSLIWVAGILTLIVSVLGFTCTRFFLKLLQVPDTCMEYAVTYLHILFCFTFGSVAYNGISSILRSVGDSKSPLYALIVSAIANTLLDILFILVFKLGVAGVAYATILSQILSAVLVLIFLLKKRKEIGLTNLSWYPERQFILRILKTGFPAAFQSCMISLGGMSVQRLINSFGSSVMAAYAAVNRIDSVAIQVIVSIGTALSVFTGQNMGQRQFERIKKALYQTLVVMVAASVIIAFCVVCFRYQLIGLFLDKNASTEAIEVGATYLSIIGIAYVIAGVMQSYQNVIRGAGDVNTCMVAGLTELAGRIIFAYLLSHFLGSTGIWIATPISWGCGCVIPIIRYYSGKWKQKGFV